MAQITALLLLIVACVIVSACDREVSASNREFSVYKNDKGDLKLDVGIREDAIVTAKFNDTIEENGWSFLEVKDRGPSWEYEDAEVAKAAGMVEGAATAHRIYQKWINTLANYCPDTPTPTSQDPEYCKRLYKFILANRAYMDKMIIEHSPQNRYWYQVDLFLHQLEGLYLGYSAVAIHPLTRMNFAIIQLFPELMALEGALNSCAGYVNRRVAGSSCSALIKVLPGNSELFVTHDTWNDYVDMLRVYKLYDLSYRMSGYDSRQIPGKRASFSSYPGSLTSIDDFYQLSSKLVTLETTNGNYNKDLWKFVTNQSVFEGIRSVVANRLATYAGEWGQYFSLYNSGTYNNQWMIVDFNQFERGQSELRSGLLWVLEQLPGTIVQEDQTQALRDQSYWPSYNVPFYSDIYNLSGFEELREQYGDWYSHDKTPRALIFKRDHCNVTDMESLIQLMKYNDFEYDPLSACNCTPPYSAINAIASRSDLNDIDGTYPFPSLGYRLHGAIDNKATCSKMMEDGYTLASKAYSGPTYQEQPPFQWSDIANVTKPLGQPELWDFETMDVSWA